MLCAESYGIFAACVVFTKNNFPRRVTARLHFKLFIFLVTASMHTTHTHPHRVAVMEELLQLRGSECSVSGRWRGSVLQD